MEDWIYEFYKENQDFHIWVEKHCRQRNLGVFEVLNHKIAKIIANYYKEA